MIFQMDGPRLPLLLPELVHQPTDHHVQQPRLQGDHPQHLSSSWQQLIVYQRGNVFAAMKKFKIFLWITNCADTWEIDLDNLCRKSLIEFQSGLLVCLLEPMK